MLELAEEADILLVVKKTPNVLLLLTARVCATGVATEKASLLEIVVLVAHNNSSIRTRRSIEIQEHTGRGG